MNITSPYTIITLLPYSETSELINKKQKIDDLYFIKSIIEISILALEGFINGDLTLFDAQVGENLCQIRACKTISLANKYLMQSSIKCKFIEEINIFRAYKNRLDTVIVQWEDFLSHASSYDINLDERESIESFINRHSLQLKLSEDIVYIIACFFLTHFSIRNEGIPSAINLNFISRELHISKYRAKRLAHRYQVIICKLGCDYIMQIARDLPDERGYAAVLPYLCQIADENRMVLPCYITSEIVFDHIIKQRTPVFFIINRIYQDDNIINDCIHFTLIGHEDEYNFKLISHKDYLSQYCMIVFGEVHIHDNNSYLHQKENYIDFVLTETPLKLILANTASHPQYSGKLLANYRENPYLLLGSKQEAKSNDYHEVNLMNMQQFAKDNGCTKNNPDTFLLKHIYAGRIGDEINNLNLKYVQSVFDVNDLI